MLWFSYPPARRRSFGRFYCVAILVAGSLFGFVLYGRLGTESQDVVIPEGLLQPDRNISHSERATPTIFSGRRVVIRYTACTGDEVFLIRGIAQRSTHILY